ncbi:hypothetical protein GCM10027075_03960 [Streptomyces heilongjiangensis]
MTADGPAGRDVRLDGDTVVSVPPGKTTYDGTFSGTGTLTVRSTGTLVPTRNQRLHPARGPAAAGREVTRRPTATPAAGRTPSPSACSAASPYR